MKPWTVAPLLLLLVGCATDVALTGIDDKTAGSGTLDLMWLQPHSIDILLDGKRYEGLWTSSLCATDACRGIYANASRIHSRHISSGQAHLQAKDGSALECKWVSHLPKVEGTCRAQDGRKFSLKQADQSVPTLPVAM